MPESYLHCWQWFLALNATRSAGMGFSPITYTEIKAYFELYSINVEPWEVEVIKIFDHIALEFAQKAQAKQDQEQKAKSRSK